MDWNVLRFLVHFFFTAVHFHLALVAASISHFVTTATKLSCCSLALDLCRPLSRWASLACHPLSLFLCFSLALYSKFLDMTINLSLILYKTRIQKKFPLSVFVLIDSLVVSASQDAGGYAISRQNNLELHLGCHTCWMSYFTLVCLWCGRSVYGHVITKFSPMGNLPHFLTYGAPLRALRARELRYKWMVEKVFLGPTNHSCLLSQGIIGQLKPARSQKQVLFYLKSFFLNKETHYMLDNFLFEKTWSNRITF